MATAVMHRRVTHSQATVGPIMIRQVTIREATVRTAMIRMAITRAATTGADTIRPAIAGAAMARPDMSNRQRLAQTDRMRLTAHPTAVMIRIIFRINNSGTRRKYYKTRGV